MKAKSIKMQNLKGMQNQMRQTCHYVMSTGAYNVNGINLYRIQVWAFIIQN